MKRCRPLPLVSDFKSKIQFKVRNYIPGSQAKGESEKKVTGRGGGLCGSQSLRMSSIPATTHRLQAYWQAQMEDTESLKMRALPDTLASQIFH